MRQIHTSMELQNGRAARPPKASDLLGGAVVDALREIVREEFAALAGAHSETLSQLLTRKNLRVGEITGIHPNTLSRLLAGKSTRLQRGTIARLAKALNEPEPLVAAAVAASQKSK